MGKAREVASSSICQPSHPVAPIAAARGATLKCGVPSRSQISNTCSFWGLGSEDRSIHPLARQETVTKPKVLWRYQEMEKGPSPKKVLNQRGRNTKTHQEPREQDQGHQTWGRIHG